jgi:hypothetical protein
MAEAQEENLLWRVHRLEQELEHLKRDLLRQLAAPSMIPFAGPPSLFGSVRGEDVPEEIIEEAKQSLCRDLKDL